MLFVVLVVSLFSINVSQLQYVLVIIHITKFVLVMIHITMAEWGIAVWWGGLCNDVKVYWSPYACSSLPALSSTIGFLFCQNTASFGKHISACVPCQDSWHKKTASCSGPFYKKKTAPYNEVLLQILHHVVEPNMKTAPCSGVPL